MSRRLRIPASVIAVSAFSLFFSLGFFLLLFPVVQNVGRDLAKLERYRQEKPVFEPQTIGDAAQNALAEETMTAVNTLLPNDPFLEAFAVQIEALSKKSGVSITSLTLSPATTSTATAPAAAAAASTGLPAGVQRSVMNLTLSGTYGNIQNFIAGVSTLTRLAAVENVSISLGNPTSTGVTSTSAPVVIGANPTLTSQITLAAYSLPNAK